MKRLLLPRAAAAALGHRFAAGWPVRVPPARAHIPPAGTAPLYDFSVPSQVIGNGFTREYPAASSASANKAALLLLRRSFSSVDLSRRGRDRPNAGSIGHAYTDELMRLES